MTKTQDGLITKLNEQIAKITWKNYDKHNELGDLEDWLDEWRIETAVISFALKVELCGKS